MSNETQPMPRKLGESKLLLRAKSLVEVDPEDGENFYAYDLVPDTEEYKEKYVGAQPVEIYVQMNPESTREYNEMKVGQRFSLGLK